MAKSDIFVVQKAKNTLGATILGKNAHLTGDVMEIIFSPASAQAPSGRQQCTLTSVVATPKTFATVLNKAAWSWGAEMGANERSVSAACVAIASKLQSSKPDGDALLPYDLVRLALERGASAKEAVAATGKLIEEIGLGGPLSESNPQLKNFDAGVVIADRSEVWILEAVRKHWVAKKLTDDAVYITNHFTIGKQFDLSSSGVAEYAKGQKLWDGAGEFDFQLAFNVGDAQTCKGGQQLLDKSTANGKFTVQSMMELLRSEEGKICLTGSGSASELSTMGSMVSLLAPSSASMGGVHFFTAASNPKMAGFKPFLFAADGSGDAVKSLLQSPTVTPDPASTTPRFASKPDRRSAFLKLHEAVACGKHPKGKSAQHVSTQVLDMEAQCVADVVESLQNNHDIFDGVTLFRDCVEAESKIYQH